MGASVLPWVVLMCGWLSHSCFPTKSLLDKVPECSPLGMPANTQRYKPNKQLRQPFDQVVMDNQTPATLQEVYICRYLYVANEVLLTGT